MPARVICKQILQTQIEELNDEMNNLMSQGYEPIKMSGINDEPVNRICILMVKSQPK